MVDKKQYQFGIWLLKSLTQFLSNVVWFACQELNSATVFMPEFPDE